jgi:hypothetical protein
MKTQRSLHSCRSLLACGLALLFAAAAESRGHAGVILGNYPPFGASPVPFVPPISSSFNTQAGMAFTMGTESYNVDSVDLLLSGYTGDVTPQLGFFQDNGAGSPGAQAGGFLHSFPNAGTLDTFSFTTSPATPVTLAANTTYWLVLDSAGGDYYWWSYLPPTPPTSTAGITFNSVQFSTDNGASYTTFLPPAGFFQINGTAVAVPEPGSALLVMAGAGGLVFGQRRRRQVQTC